MIDILIIAAAALVWLSAFINILYLLTNMDMYEWDICYLLESIIDHNNGIRLMEKLK